MQTIANISSSPAAGEHLLRLPLALLHPHPLNANRMDEARLTKLTANIQLEGRYPPLIVRPHPDLAGEYQLLDGQHRVEAIKRCSFSDALCYLWPCDDTTALTLLATLNRLEGEDVPALRAKLLAELTALISAEELARLLPEDAALINDTLALYALDADALLAEFTTASLREAGDSPRLVSFALSQEDELVVEAAIAAASAGLEGRNRRGRALGLIARQFFEVCERG